MQGLTIDALTSKRIPLASKPHFLQPLIAGNATRAIQSSKGGHVAVTSHPASPATAGTASHAILPMSGTQQSRIYDGTMTVSGSLSTTSGQTGTWSGTLTDEIVMSVDRSGNGIGGETFSGNITLTVTNPDGTQKSNTGPLTFFLPLFTLQHGKFTYSESSGFDLSGLMASLDVKGSFSGSQATISEHLSIPFSGFVNGTLVSGTLKGSGSLTTTPLTVTGAGSNLAVYAGSKATPFGAVQVTDLNGGSMTATVTLSHPANGTLTNLKGGTYNRAKGTYTITGNETTINLALKGLTFQSAGKSNSPFRKATTGFTLSVTDTKGASETDGATKVIATNPLYINGVVANQTTVGGNAIAPFRHVTIKDLSSSTAVEVVKVTLSDPKNGTLEHVGGIYNAKTGTYLIHASPASATAALRALKFDPANASGSAVTTGFTITVINAAGATMTNSKASITANPPTPAASGVALFSQYVASGMHGIPAHSAAISAFHDLALPSHFEFASSHR
jgi:hypothetical protein